MLSRNLDILDIWRNRICVLLDFMGHRMVNLPDVCLARTGRRRMNNQRWFYINFDSKMCTCSNCKMKHLLADVYRKNKCPNCKMDNHHWTKLDGKNWKMTIKGTQE
jgi:Zn finger protein HypA/HybF involved in hydrogenase expression